MKNPMFKQIGLAIICISMFAVALSVEPVFSQPPIPARGPITDTIRWKVVRGRAAQRRDMTSGPTKGGSDVWMGLDAPASVRMMSGQGKTVSSKAAFHMGYFGFNYRRLPLNDVNFRHALAHLVPKDMIIGTLFQYIAVRIDTPMSPAHGLWFNPTVDPHPYNPSESETILAAAGYQKISGVWRMPDGTSIPTLRVYCPLAIVSPTSNAIATMLVAEATKIGLANLVLTPMASSTYLDLVLNQRNFDIFWLCYELSKSPTHLNGMFHSSNDFPGGDNCYGINYPELDARLDILWTSLDHMAQVAATQEAQELVMGGRTTDPLPTYVPTGDPRSYAIPVIPVYSRNAFDAQQPSLRGAVNMQGYGINNIWTWMSIYWNTPGGFRPGTTTVMVVPILEDFPERLNPLFASTTYARTFIDPVFDSLIETNPYTLRDIPSLAHSWSYMAVPGGMDVTFNLRLTDSGGTPITWQDGVSISVTDVKFAWDFLHDWEIPKYWSTMGSYDPSNTVIVDADTIRAHMTTTSQWLLYELAATAYLLPPQIWENNPLTGDPWTNTAEILGFDPSAYAGPGGAPTMLYGTGPFKLMSSTTAIGVGGFGDLDANRGYWRTGTEIPQLLTDMFHSAGDVDYDGEIDGEDLSAIGLAYRTTPGDYLWNPNADICGEAGGPPDGVVNIYDLSQAGKFYGETKYVPYP